MWVANIDGKSVSKIDPQEAQMIDRPIPMGQRPNDLAVGDGSVWVIDNINGTLTRIDPDALSVEGDRSTSARTRAESRPASATSGWPTARTAR